MSRILGIDPGSRITGYGIIDMNHGRGRYQDSGSIHTPTGQTSLAVRLLTIFQGINELIATYRPDVMAIEQIFMHRNADSALKLGQARGVAICAGAAAQLPVHEYTPRAVKQAIVGHGGAAKTQVQHMVCALLELQHRLQPDAADALAVALCHGHTVRTLGRLQQAGTVQTGRS